MRTTIKDVAKAANVSYSTVSRALAGNSQISEKTRKKIIETAKSMGYLPNTIAKSLVTKSTSTLGLIVSDITNPFFLEAMEGVEEYAANYGYSVYLCNTNWNIDKEKQCINRLYGSSVDGIIIFPVSNDISHILDIQEAVPTVLVNYKPDTEICNYVAFNDYDSTIEAMRYLIKLGHTKIAFVGGLEINRSDIVRLKGYKKVLSECGIPINDSYIAHGDYKQSSGYQLTKSMFSENNVLPTAIIAGNDVMALGAIQALEELGLSVPGDVSVIGFDDISYSSLYKIQLTTICLPRYELGKCSVELLLSKIRNTKDCCVCSKVLDTEFVIRNSCAKVCL